MNAIKKVIIPVAGLGTRFLPATKAQPKEMLPIVDKPIIQYLVEEAVASGITEVIFVTGRGKRAIEDHFDYAYELEQVLVKRGKKELIKTIREISNLASFTYVRQKEPRGDGDALLAAAHLVGDEPCAVLFGDDLIDGKVPCLKQMIKVFERYGDPVIALEEVAKKEVSSYGVVAAIPIDNKIYPVRNNPPKPFGRVSAGAISNRVYEVKNIVEKPAVKDAPSNLAIVGKYIITKNVFDELRKLRSTCEQRERSRVVAPNGTMKHRMTATRGEIHLSDALKNVLRRQAVYPVSGHARAKGASPKDRGAATTNRVYGYRFDGRRYDCGSKIGFLKAIVDFGLKHKETKKEFKKYLKRKFS